MHSTVKTLILLSTTLSAMAQQRGLQLERIVGKRVALVIGNNSYQNGL